MGARPIPTTKSTRTETRMASVNSFGAKGTLDVDGKSYGIFRLDAFVRRHMRKK